MCADTKPRFELGLNSASVGTEDPEINKVQNFLTRFGYLDETITPGMLDQPTSEALEKFQQIYNLPTTGELTPDTARAMEMPRCGTPDVGLIPVATNGGTSSNFVLRGCDYNTLNLTYRFVNGTGDIPGTQERNAVRNAFNTWQDALCGVTFTERSGGPTDFEVGWFTGNHGDGSPFDGVGNVLAHAFYPPPCGGIHAGEFHCDESESWSLTGAGGTFDLETVALHEIGHLLGLDHSSVNGSVMFPSYGGVRRNLTQDDLDGIRRLYPFVCRRGDSGSKAGFVSDIAAVRHNQRQVITAVRTQAGKLKLIAWDVTSSGAINRTGDSGNQAGSATSIEIARNTTGPRFVTACRSGSARLFLITWDINASGTSITRLSDSGTQAGTASMIRLVTSKANRFVTACRDSSGNLKLIGWRMNPNGSLTRLADSGNQAGKILDLDMVDLPNDRVLTAVRAADGHLLLITWSISDGAITRIADSGNAAGNARIIRATVDQSGNVVTAVKAANNDLLLITWRISSSGAITRLNDSHGLAGETKDHDISIAGGRVVTAVRTSNGTLKVLLWQTTSNGTITRIGDSDNLAGTASLITQCEPLSGAPPIVTSVRTATNTLKLISWSPG